MKVFRTVINPEQPEWSLEYSQQTVMMGSCFTENVGNRLKEKLFPVDLNPFGVLFNPVSIASGIQRLISAEKYEEDDLFFLDGLWHSFDHHSRFSGIDPIEVLSGINSRLEMSSSKIAEAGNLFITLGTARVFYHTKTGRVVSNCHKVPADEFQYQLLRIGDIMRLYTRIFNDLWHINPDLNIVLTVSPVRYWKDGPNGNQISKATLLLAVSELVKKFDKVSYFPAYEIFMDDLRDYRFYDQDMLHPGSSGIDYVWDKFSACYMSDETLIIMSRIEKIVKALSHRPRNPETKTHKEFQKKLEAKIRTLKSDHPEIAINFL